MTRGSDNPTLRAVAVCGLWLAAWGLVSCARPQPTPRAAHWRPREFLIGLHDAPPTKPTLYAQAAKAGFNVIVDYVGPDSLDLAHRYGLKLMVAQIGLDVRTWKRDDRHELAHKAIERFRRHPALWGYYVGGDVRERQLADGADLASFVRQRDPGRPFFVSVLPCDAWVGPALATADYAGYLERVIQAMHPPLLNTAHEPFPAKREGRFYFENLELLRRAALAHDVVLCPTVRCGLRPGTRPPGQGDLRWQAYTALAYGARCIVWLGYWQPPHGEGEGIVAPDGTPSERFHWVAALNGELRRLGPQLLRLRSAGVYHTGATVPVGTTRLPVHGLVGSVDGGTFVVGEFHGGPDERAVMVVNCDTRQAVQATVTINRPCRSVAWLDPASGDWRQLPIQGDRLGTKLELPLAPGGGKLLRLAPAN